MSSGTDPETVTNENWDVEALIAQHQAGVWRYLRAIGCDESLADDLTQEAFLAVIRRPFQQVNHAATASYLRRVAYHLLISFRRRQSRETVTEELDILDSQWMRWAGADVDGNQALDRLTDCFKRLTQRAQLSLRMRFSENATRERIAEVLGITEHGAKNLMQRAKAQLKRCIDEKTTGQLQ